MAFIFYQNPFIIFYLKAFKIHVYINRFTD